MMKKSWMRNMGAALLAAVAVIGLVIVLAGERASGGQQCSCPVSWPAQRTRNLTTAELSCCDCWELEIMRNEIYARHGRIFNRKDLQEYFEGQPWYRPDPSNPEGTRGQNSTEKRNASFILNIEKGRGCR
jgi:serine/threonine protein kinase, bacterial